MLNPEHGLILPAGKKLQEAVLAVPDNCGHDIQCLPELVGVGLGVFIAGGEHPDVIGLVFKWRHFEFI